MNEATVDYTLTPEAKYRAAIYDDLMTRYSELDKVKSIPMQAVRLLIVRHGFDVFMNALLGRGAAWTATKARQEIATRREFITHLMITHPSDDPDHLREAIEEMAADVAAISSGEGRMRLLRYLERLRTRHHVRAKARHQSVH